jgi:hypothetical protein
MKTIEIIAEQFSAHNHVFRGYGLLRSYNRIEFRAESQSGKTLKKWTFPMDDSYTRKELLHEFELFRDSVCERFPNCKIEKGLFEL